MDRLCEVSQEVARDLLAEPEEVAEIISGLPCWRAMGIPLLTHCVWMALAYSTDLPPQCG